LFGGMNFSITFDSPKFRKMKKLLLSIAIFLCIGFAAKATHLMGGQITSKNIGGLTYEITLTVYRDTLGIPVNTSINIRYINSTLTYDYTKSINVSPASSFGNGVETYYYIDTITFPAADNYDIYYNDCCRNCAILNIPNPCGFGFSLHNSLSADSSNSSPIFLNEPITLAQLNVPFSYNPLPFDIDGDSLSWSLDIPQDAYPATPIPGYVLPSSDSLYPFTMNPLTGEITFLPNQVGYFAASVLVNEYRAGVLIGTIRRDMQIIVLQSSNVPALITLNSGNYPYSGKNYTVNPGSPFTYTVVASDPDNANVWMSANGEAFRLLNNPATVTNSPIGATFSSSVSWTPTAVNARTQPYVFGIRVTENYNGVNFSQDLSVNLRVGNFTGIQEVNSVNGISVYPNPTQSRAELKINAKESGLATISISNMIGQTVKVMTDINVNVGQNLIELNDLNLKTGSYIISIQQNNKNLGVTRLNIQ
jgi:hypothetical protein